ncbi:MAG: type II toxin-antitoxin system VapC family toxin [Calditrichaeota bacterium]|nr:type II toxin-antitoxin system VapC family toxin [Calditrichota bacterium]
MISEPMSSNPHLEVVRWLSQRSTEQFATTTISVAEVLRGLNLLPDGQKKKRLEDKFALFIDEIFPGRIFPFDLQAAAYFGRLTGIREKAGLPVDVADMMIGAITLTREASLATRNTRDFSNCGISLHNPWSATQ